MLVSKSPSGRAVRMVEAAYMFDTGADVTRASLHPYLIDMGSIQESQCFISIANPPSAGESVSLTITDLSTGLLLVNAFVVDVVNGVPNTFIPVPIVPRIAANPETNRFFLIEAAQTAGAGAAIENANVLVLFSSRSARAEVSVAR